ncbi:MAG TPA: DinB family protein [Holophagaceae bacterium]|nr:DinB family protein [Holophagaceae bacterium]
MSLARDLRRHHRTLDALEAALDRFDEAAWTRGAADGGWCPAQVYRHLQIVAEQFAFKHLETCLQGGGNPEGRMKFRGRLIFLLGRFPKGRRIKVEFPPDMVPEAVDKEAARRILASLRAQAEAFAARLPGADPRQRAKHFLLGWLGPRDWFRFIEMHHRHHLEGQLRRLLER